MVVSNWFYEHVNKISGLPSHWVLRDAVILKNEPESQKHLVESVP